MITNIWYNSCRFPPFLVRKDLRGFSAWQKVTWWVQAWWGGWWRRCSKPFGGWTRGHNFVVSTCPFMFNQTRFPLIIVFSNMISWPGLDLSEQSSRHQCEHLMILTSISSEHKKIKLCWWICSSPAARAEHHQWHPVTALVWTDEIYQQHEKPLNASAAGHWPTSQKHLPLCFVPVLENTGNAAFVQPQKQTP